jgi:hypothetical protein
LKPYFLTVAKRIKETFPDVLLERVVLPKVDVGESSFGSGEALAGSTFEVLVDGKAVITSTGMRKSSYLQQHSHGRLTVFVSMGELEIAIGRARRKRRPSTVYGDEDSGPRLQALKNKASAIKNVRKAKSD